MAAESYGRTAIYYMGTVQPTSQSVHLETAGWRARTSCDTLKLKFGARDLSRPLFVTKGFRPFVRLMVTCMQRMGHRSACSDTYLMHMSGSRAGSLGRPAR